MAEHQRGCLTCPGLTAGSTQLGLAASSILTPGHCSEGLPGANTALNDSMAWLRWGRMQEPAGRKRPLEYMWRIWPSGPLALEPGVHMCAHTDFLIAWLPGWYVHCLCQYYNCTWTSCGQGLTWGCHEGQPPRMDASAWGRVDTGVLRPVLHLFNPTIPA